MPSTCGPHRPHPYSTPKKSLNTHTSFELRLAPAASSFVAIPTPSHWQAKIKGVAPKLFAISSVATPLSFSSSASKQVSLPSQAAVANGLIPLLSRRDASAPAARRSCTDYSRKPGESIIHQRRMQFPARSRYDLEQNVRYTISKSPTRDQKVGIAPSEKSMLLYNLPCQHAL